MPKLNALLNWRGIYKLLDSGAYEQAAGLLHRAAGRQRPRLLPAESDVVAIAAVCAKSAWPACNARRKSSGTARQVKQPSDASNN